jgi:hypothetical protein
MRLIGGRRIATGLALAAVVVAVAAAWGPSVARVRASRTDVPAVQVTPSFFFGPRMARAEAIVVIGGVTHDFLVDRGRLTAKTPSSVTLRERDGTSHTIAVAPTAQITLAGQPVPLRRLRRGFLVTTVRDGEAAAGWVKATR